MGRHKALFFTLLLTAGCATQPVSIDSTMPVLPKEWSHQTASAAGRVNQEWWFSFGSAELSHLIEQAQAQSLDITAATARVRQAEASTQIAAATLLPTVSSHLNASREGRIGGNANVDGSHYGAVFSTSYELDLWGGNRARRDSALATLQSDIFARDTVQLTVTTGVASAWLQVVGLHERIAIANQSLHSAERLLTLIESRVRAGAATPLELAQQRGQVASQQRSLAELQRQVSDAQTVAALLLGQAHKPNISLGTLADVQAPVITSGLPAELLTRRPDIARAEARLLAADANVLVARAAMLPNLKLTGGVSSGSDRLLHTLDHPLYSLASGLTAPIFNAGQLAAGRDLALAQREELLADYHMAIIAAFSDVEIALNTLAGIDAQITAQAEVLRQAQRALDLAENRYRAGADTLLVLLDAQRTRYSAHDDAVQLNMLRLQASVALYKALGGGWSMQSS